MEYGYYQACSLDDLEAVRRYLPYLQDKILIKGLLCCSFYSRCFLEIATYSPVLITDNILTWIILSAPVGTLEEVLKHKQAKLEHIVLCILKGSLINLNILIIHNPSLVSEHLQFLRKLALGAKRQGVVTLFSNSNL